jgi:hypothetical protein
MSKQAMFRGKTTWYPETVAEGAPKVRRQLPKLITDAAP